MSLPEPRSQGAEPGGHKGAEPHGGSLAGKLNWLRAGVLGANDGIVSTAGLVVGVAAATTTEQAILTAGVAGLAAGAVSMALGEYVSVSTQRDTERAALIAERRELDTMPEAELSELEDLLESWGLSETTARTAAEEMTARDPLAAHAQVELRIDPSELANPWLAALSSAVSFTLGALVPLLVIVLAPDEVRIAVTFGAVLLALAVTGSTSAWLGGARRGRAVVRVVLGGALAMGVTYGIGQIFDVAV